MSGVTSCKQCGCSEIDNDPTRGNSVCTNCGFVLEESIIVSEVAFEENGHGGSSAIGQFVSIESRGGGISSATTGFHSGISKESRELTLKSAKKKINEVAQQLRLNQHCVDVAFNFFKMALHKQLTKGRKNALTIAACVYMTCRIEGTPHLLIDFSDIAQIDVYALGRAYVQISRALFINIPAVDPCMYILRFAHKFNLAEKTHDVAMTALRLVQRMKRDWIHLGRRPSGLCGAALLIAARLHSFSRSVQDVINVVKVHETTLRKRLIEFGETPSSSLTLDEFMSVDLEEEHDPPSFKAARIKDREMLQKLLDGEVNLEFKDIQRKIDEELEKRRKRTAKDKETPPPSPSPSIEVIRLEDEDTSRFIMETTLCAINEFITDPVEVIEEPNTIALEQPPLTKEVDMLLMPPPTSIDLESSAPLECLESLETEQSKVDDEELSLEGIDDAELDGYIMNEREVARKTHLWEQLNSEYITQQRMKQEQIEKDLREGKTEKKAKKKKPVKVKATFHAKSANEAIKIMLMERKISTKINYDVLKKLNANSKGEEETMEF